MLRRGRRGLPGLSDPPAGDSSSADLHPTSGGRFAFARIALQPLEYAITVHLPGGRVLETRLRWEGRRAVLDPALEGVDAWSHHEALKLARVVHASKQARLTRWRG